MNPSTPATHEQNLLPSQPRSEHSLPKVERGLTSYVFLAAILGSGVLLNLYLNGSIPWWTYCSLSITPHWFFLVAAHDALHQSAHSNAKMNRVIGWLANGFFLLPYPLIRRAHLFHHAREGTEDDIEQFGHRAGFTLPIRLILGMWCFYSFLPRCDRKIRAQAALMLFAAIAGLVYWPETFLWGWLIPMQIMSCLTAVFYIYLPHGPLADWIDCHAPVLTGYHVQHHVAPAYPSHQIGNRQIRDAIRNAKRAIPRCVHSPAV